MRPTNCGLIVRSPWSWDRIQGPLEAILTPPHLPDAISYMGEVYKLIGGTPDTVPTDYLWPSPHDNDYFVRVVMAVDSYRLVVEYMYHYGCYKCYGVVDCCDTIIAIHYIYGPGNLLSIVQVVKQYCNIHAPRYIPCRTCWYRGSSGNECGQGLEMNTGDCSSWMDRAGPLHNQS